MSGEEKFTKPQEETVLINSVYTETGISAHYNHMHYGTVSTCTLLATDFLDTPTATLLMNDFLAGNVHFEGHEDHACVIHDMQKNAGLYPDLKVDLCTYCTLIFRFCLSSDKCGIAKNSPERAHFWIQPFILVIIHVMQTLYWPIYSNTSSLHTPTEGCGCDTWSVLISP